MADRAVQYVVVEMQNGVVANRSWAYDTKEDAEVKYYQVLAEAVKSPVEVHTVMLMTDEGFLLEAPKHYYHPEAE